MSYHIKLALRNMLKQKMGSLINIIGLSVSLAACLIIVLFVQEELSFDKFNTKYKNIYRLLDADNSQRYPDHPIVFNKILEDNVPELQNGMMLFYYNKATDFFRHNNEDFFFNDVVFTTQNFFDIFTVEFIKGNPKKALDSPNKIVISESVAQLMFGDKNPIGEILNFENVYEFEISGIIKDLPSTSHFQVDLLASIQAQKTINPQMMESWYNSSTSFYYLLPNDIDITKLEKKVTDVHEQHRSKDISESSFEFQPLSKIHLYSANTSWDSAIKGDIRVVIAFILIAVLIFSIACFNYINLSIALASKRIYFTAIQKTMGANGKSIFASTVFESLLLVVICTIAAVLVSILFIPGFNSIMGTNLTFSLTNWLIIGVLLGFVLLIVLVSSLYQAWHRSGINPSAVISGKNKNLYLGKGHFFSAFSQSLTVTQLIISIILFIGVITIHKQTILLLNKKLGFNKSQLISIKNPYDEEVHKRYALFKDQVIKIPGVKGVSASWNVPGEYINNYSDVNVIGNQNRYNFGQVPIDYNFFKVLETNFLHGRTFDPLLGSDSSMAIINKIGMDLLGLVDPIDQQVKNHFNGVKEYKIVGIVDDIQYRSLKEKGKPVIYYLSKFGKSKILVKLNPGDIPHTIEEVRKVWNKIESNDPFEFEFVDQKIQANYIKETRTRSVLSIMALLAISISMLGIFGLCVFISQNRTKEIGIRKVNGAKTIEIVAMLNKIFVKWVAVAFLLACPIAYYAMNKWLENFAYKTELNWWIFALAGIIAMGIALLTVSWQSWRAARRNPVESLRYE